MKKVISLLLFVCLIFAAQAQTPVSGYILSNTTWTTANSPYIVTGNILVNNGITLTIEAGVMVKFDTTKTLQVDGELIAMGTAQRRIMFTALDSTPVKGSWGRIQFSNTSSDAVFDTSGNYLSGSILKYCDVSYGGGIAGDVTLYCDTAAPYFSNCRISECLKHAFRFTQAVGRVDSSSIRNCGGTAIDYTNPVLTALILINDTLETNGGGVGRSGTGHFSSITVRHSVFTSTGNAISNVGSSSDLVIENNVFSSCSTAFNGTAVINSVISNNTFTANLEVIEGNLGMNASISSNTFIGNARGVLGHTVCLSSYGLTASNIVIAGNYFKNNKGVITLSSNFSIIENNNFVNNQFYYGHCYEPFGGGYIYYYEFIRLKTGQGLFVNNIIDSTTSGGNTSLIELQGQWEIANNLIKNNSRAHISCIGTTNICSNRFLNNLGPAISSSGSVVNNYIHHNEFLNNAGTGSVIYIDNNSTLNNNEFIGNSGSGNNSIVTVSGSSPLITHNTFTGNSCSGTSSVVSISGGSSTVADNEFTGNQISGSGAVVSMSNSPSNVHNNQFQNNSGVISLRISGNNLPVIGQNNFINPAIQYEVENLIPFGPGANIDLSSNFWGTTNSAHIDSVIKDYFDDANLSVALYIPVLTVPSIVDTSTPCTIIICSLSVNETIVNPSCYGGNDGSISLSVSNGTVPYSYFWNNGASTQNRSNLSSGSYSVTVVDSNFCSATTSFTLTQPASPVSVISAVVTDANCNTGGSINITAGGGTSPYTYNWGDGITAQDRTGLNTGSYSVTITDSKGCAASQSFTIGQVTGPVISGAVANASCHAACDGVINLSVTGIAPFTYNWGSGFSTNADTSGLCPGNYQVTVADSNNCGIACSFTITAPGELITSANIFSDVTCFGYSDGAATAVAQGGTAPYNFLWSDGQTTNIATRLSAGTYVVTVTDSLGCVASAFVVIPNGFNVFVGVIVGLNSADVNQNAVYSVNANPNYTYDWSVSNGIIVSGEGTNGIEVAWISAGTGTIQLIATENGCSDTVSKSITITDTIRNCSAVFYLYPDTIPHTYFIVNTASGIPQLYYLWNWGDGSAIDSLPYPTHTYSTPGFYTICLTITDSSGCSDTYCHPYYLLKDAEGMVQVNVYPSSYTAIRDNLPDHIAVYPNPANNTLTITASTVQQQATITLLDALGRTFWQQIAQPGELSSGIELDLHRINEGIYFLHVRTSGGNRIIKVVKY